MNRREFLGLGAASIAAISLSARGWAQSAYPDRAVKLVVPRSSGGVVDIIAREWSEKVSTTFGSTYVENMGGGGGVIGAAAVAHAPADGYALLFGTTSELILRPIIKPQSYDPLTSFAPIAILCESVAAIVVNPKVPATDLDELVAYAHQNSGHLVYGSAGTDTVSNLAGELFKKLTGLSDITHVPYDGGGPALTDLIAGHIPIMTPMITQTNIEMHRSGHIRVLAVASEHRLTAVPDIPTAAEQGYPALLARLFVGLFAPAKTPDPVIAKIAAVTQEAMLDPSLQKNFAAAGFEPVTGSDATSARHYLEQEIVRWKPLLEQLHLGQN